MELLRREWFTDNLLSHFVTQIKWMYNSKFMREVYYPDHNTNVFAVIGGLRMEFTSDGEAIHFFTVLEGTGVPTSSKQKRLKLTLDNGITLFGHYTFHATAMHTHFRFSPTRDGMLALLKLVDHSVGRMVALIS